MRFGYGTSCLTTTETAADLFWRHAPPGQALLKTPERKTEEHEEGSAEGGPWRVVGHEQGSRSSLVLEKTDAGDLLVLPSTKKGCRSAALGEHEDFLRCLGSTQKMPEPGLRRDSLENQSEPAQATFKAARRAS